MSKTKLVRPATWMHYSETLIGGSEQLKVWRLQRQEFEDKWQEKQVLKRKAIAESAATIVRGDKKPRDMNEMEKRMFKTQKLWQKAFVENRCYPEGPYLEYQPLKPKSFWQKIKDFVYNALFPKSH